MNGRLKVVWLSQYPLPLISESIQIVRKKTYHASSWIVNLSREIAKREDVDLHLITESPLVKRSQVARVGDITFHIVKTGVPFMNRGFPRFFPFDLLTGFYLTAKRLSEVVRRIRPDVVHGHGTEGPYSLAGLRSSYPCLISIQGIITEYAKRDPRPLTRFIAVLERAQIRRGRYFACRTQFDTGFVSGNNGRAKIFQIDEAMNPIFFQRTWSPLANRQILFVGDLIRRKGPENLMRALFSVKEWFPDVELLLVGQGPSDYLRHLRNLSQLLGIDQNVKFLGLRQAAEIADLHHQCQIFVLPTVIDNSPNSLAEAMVSGMPVVATRVGGIPSMIEDTDNGLLVEPNDPLSLAKRILFLLRSPQEMKRLGENARSIATKRHLPAAVSEKTVEAYRQILLLERSRLSSAV